VELVVNQLPAMVCTTFCPPQDVLLNNYFKGNDHQTEIMVFMASLHKSLLTAISSACEEGSGFTSSQLKDLFKLGIVAIRHTQRINSALCQQVWEPDAWRVLCGRLQASRFKLSPALQKMCEQLIGLAQARGSSSKSSTRPDARTLGTSKRKAVNVPEGDTVSQVKKPKRETKLKEIRLG
jgi:DNA polymerase phi